MKLPTLSGMLPRIMKAAGIGSLFNVGHRGGSWLRILSSGGETKPGAWQQNIETGPDAVLNNPVVYRCLHLISSSIAKLRLRLVELDANGIWSEATSASFSPVLKKPNHYQTRQQFIALWLLSKLIWGNAYILKARDNRGVVVALYILNPQMVTAQVSVETGRVFYQLSADPLSEIPMGAVNVPASEIINSVMMPLFHPLCGVSPLYAAGLAAAQGNKIANYSATSFANGARPSGVLSTPQNMSEPEADAAYANWTRMFSGPESAGKIAVLGKDFTYTPIAHTSVESEAVQQFKLSNEQICTAFGVPAHMAGVGPVPTAGNVEALQIAFYSQTLQDHMEDIEILLDEGLGLDEKKDGRTLGTEFMREDLLKMDTKALLESLKLGIDAAVFTPNEARVRLSLPPVAGGDTPYMQQQNFSLQALYERDQDDPFSKPTVAPPAAPAPSASLKDDPKEEEGIGEEDVKEMLELLAKGLSCETN